MERNLPNLIKNSVEHQFWGRDVKRLGLTTAIVAMTIAGANAADLPAAYPPTYKAPPVQTYRWTGCYVGGGGGYGTWKQDSFVTNGAPITADVSNGGSGGFGQAQVGCDYQFTAPIFNASAVAGLFADYAGGRIAGNTDFPGVVGTYSETGVWSVGGRLGFLVTPRILTYFDGGYTQAHFDQVNYNLAIAGTPATGLVLASHSYNGWFIGSGFEYQFNWFPSGLFVKTEYRYSQFGGSNGDGLPITGSAGGGIAVPAGIALQSKLSTQMISTELVWRFNWPGH